MAELPLSSWLPITRDEALKRGWEEVDVVLISGDAYVDHPAFANAVIARVIEAAGYRVALVPQPNWQDDLRDFRKFGKPRLCFAVSAGNMDSMVNHYTANKRLRSDDAYTPGGMAGFRPDYATVTYSRILKQLYPDVPVIIGGIEASMRRLTHYDYWSDSLKPSILQDSKADLLVYGMGEQGIRMILEQLSQGKEVSQMHTIPQTVFATTPETAEKLLENRKLQELPSYETCLNDKKAFSASFKPIEQESNKSNAKTLVQKSLGQVVIVNPPFPLMQKEALDAIYDLPFTRLPHPKYKKRGVVPAYEMIRHSVTIHRGCFGGCAFCTLSVHQGKFIASRSEESILKELEAITHMPDFKGHVSDLGGPSANMYKLQGFDLEMCAKCSRASCLFPNLCKNLDINHKPLTQLYKKAEKVPGIKKVTIGSGVRYDMLIPDNEAASKQFGLDEYSRQLIGHHVSGRLKVAPEHTSDDVLKIMRKPSFRLFHQFSRKFEEINRSLGMNQQIIPYFISSHPGSKLKDMANLAVETKSLGFQLEQVQDFTPTPMTLASVIYYSGIHPFTGEAVYTARSKEEKLDQRQFFFWYKNENKERIRRNLSKIGEEKLIPQLLGKNQPGKPR
ncbi:MAG: YgiQ family radical SAM protein [Bacteroidales bacterium]|nr:YgiQ family radical SAM protein [Bacteroidales bacterium]